MSETNPAQLIFEQLIEIPEPDRHTAAQRLCENRQPLMDEVRGLLDAYDSSGNFLDLPFGDERFGTDPYPQSGDQIGRYTLLEMIGEGGFGQVFAAELNKANSANARSKNAYPTTVQMRQVAIKLIKPGMATKEVLKRFANERHALSVMDHPNIASVIDAGVTTQQTPYFVMELFRGVPLTRFCDEQRLTVLERIQLFTSVCSAIQYAHQKGIIHRDIKPSNILARKVAGRVEFKVIDFGVAKAIGSHTNDGSTLTRATQLVGTPLYMSPEQVDSLLDIDVRADVYSLGTVLYELLAGSTPLGGDSIRHGYLEVSRAIREQPTEAPSRRLSGPNDQKVDIAENRSVTPAQLRRFVRGDLDWIVLKALAKDRSRRYQSPDEFARDLQRFANNEVVEARPPSRVYRFRKFVARNQKACAVAAVCLLSLLTTTFVSIRHMRIAHHASSVAINEKQRAESLANVFIGDFDSTKAMQFDTQNDFAHNVERRIEALLDPANHNEASPHLKLDLINVLCKIYFDSKNYSEAARVMKQAREFAQSDAFPKKVIYTVEDDVQYGTLLCWAQEFSDAETILRKSLENLADHSDDFPLKRNCLIELGIASHNLDQKDASELLNRAAETIRPDAVNQLWQVRRLVSELIHAGEARNAVRVASTVLEGARASDSREGQAQAMAALGWAYYANGDIDRMRPLLRDAMDIVSKDPSNSDVPISDLGIFRDLNNDGLVTPVDAIRIINELNQAPSD